MGVPTFIVERVREGATWQSSRWPSLWPIEVPVSRTEARTRGETREALGHAAKVGGLTGKPRSPSRNCTCGCSALQNPASVDDDLVLDGDDMCIGGSPRPPAIRSRGPRTRCRGPNRSTFHGSTVTTLRALSRTSVTWTGTGRWNGAAGYTFEATVVDQGSSGSKKGDTINVLIYPSGNRSHPVFTTSTSQTLKGGNITVH